MVDMKRAKFEAVRRDLEKKMVFLSGPRQVGKTWLSQKVATTFARSLYLNYDNIEDRAVILNNRPHPATDLLVLDELHKMPEWKNFLKGLYDTKPEHLRILVTGSARLDTFTRSGDSLAGRYFRHRLNPLSPKELGSGSEQNMTRLMERGGFPEPLLADNDDDVRRWRMQYCDSLIREDVLDFEKIHDLKAMQLVLELLRQRVGSPLSYTSIARDIGCAPNTIRKYIQILEALYIVFRITPYHHNIARSLLKEPKIYFYDTGMVKGGDGPRLENCVALCLLKHANAMEDEKGREARLHYLRTKDKKEVDFLLAVEGAPLQMIEVKQSDPAISRNLRHFRQKYGFAALQLVRHLRHEQLVDGIELRRAGDYLAGLRA